MSKTVTREYHVRFESDEKTGNLISESWWHKGRRHRAGAPSYILYDNETGRRLAEQWRAPDGLYHREDGKPAKWKMASASGVIINEVYFEHGKRHRTDGPAVVHRDIETGISLCEEWYAHGTRHRPKLGASITEKDPGTGVVTREEYHFHGRLDREHGPALIRRNAITGEITRVQYFIDGEEVDPPSREIDIPGLG